MNLEYDLKAFKNSDGTWAVRGKATAYEAGQVLTHQDKLKTPVFAEVEESTTEGPKEKQDLLDWAVKFARRQDYKGKLQMKIDQQLAALGLSQEVAKPVCARVKL